MADHINNKRDSGEGTETANQDLFLRPATDEDVQNVIDRASHWRKAARRIAWHAYRVFQERESDLRQVNAKEAVEKVAGKYIAEMLGKIDRGDFLHGFNPDRLSLEANLLDKAVMYLTHFFGTRYRDERSKQRKNRQLADPEVAEEVRTIIDSGHEEEMPPLPFPQWLEVPKNFSMKWRTAVHMSWPKAQFETDAELQLREVSLDELQGPAQSAGVAPDVWLDQHAMAARSLWVEAFGKLRQQLRKQDETLNKRITEIQSLTPDPGKFESNEKTQNEYLTASENLNASRERFRELERKLWRITIESQVLQFRAIPYSTLLGLGESDKRNGADVRRSRLMANMHKIFVFGEEYQNVLKDQGANQK